MEKKKYNLQFVGKLSDSNEDKSGSTVHNLRKLPRDSPSPVAWFSVEPDVGVLELNKEIETLASKLELLQKQVVTNEQLPQLRDQILEVVNIAGRVQEAGKELKAPILIPALDDLAVPLVPSDWVYRLEEYRSDETIAFILVGLFGGAILGILGNWATNPQFEITRISFILMLLFFLLGVFACRWAFVIRARAAIVKQRMLLRPSLPKAEDEDKPNSPTPSENQN
jgi:hypothetical protein